MTNNLRKGVTPPGDRPVRIALAGNPNSGKTTLFNDITGSRQHVGNYPGVTVEKKEGYCEQNGHRLNIIDLPGTYSLTAYSPEELIARNFLALEPPDVVVGVLDSSNLERNLYLAIQILELGCHTVLALNMADIAKQRGIEFDLDLLRRFLGAPLVHTVGHRGKGKNELLETAIEVSQSAAPAPLRVDYGPEIEKAIEDVERLLDKHSITYGATPRRWLAIKLIEGDQEITELVDNAEISDYIAKVIQNCERRTGDTPEATIADRRYGFIAGVCREAVQETAEARRTLSDRIDAIVVDRLFGLPIFLLMMYLVFQLTFKLGNPPMDWIEGGFAKLSVFVSGLWPAGSESMLRSLLVDGVINGVGGVIVFLPNIILLFLAIAALEDSGYMARAAFLMDRIMHKIGLHGKSFVPMLIGFGCTVPAIMATRTLENWRDRITTILVLPLMSCGARLVIYALLIPAFFPEKWHAPVLWSVYLIGIILAIVSAKILRSTLFKGEAPPFVMELPPYRLPTIKSVTIHMWNRVGHYITKAATVILGISIILWGLQQWPQLPESRLGQYEAQRVAIEKRADIEPSEIQAQIATVNNLQAEDELAHSVLGRIGRGLEPVLKYCGFDWKISTAFIGAFAAKEVFVSQMGIVYSLGENQNEESLSLREKLRAHYSPLVGFCIILFSLITAPCLATVVMTRRESGSWKWAIFQLVGLTIMAWVVTTVVYQVGSLFI